MKLSVLLFFALFSMSAFAKPILCSLKHAKGAISVASEHSDYDKNRHCSVSCMLAIRCNDREVLLVGYLKEFRDLMGEGNAEAQDMVANKFGISLVKNQRARINQECLDQCDLRY